MTFILKENNENWFELHSTFHSIGLSYNDLVELNRLTREKIAQIENRHKREAQK